MNNNKWVPYFQSLRDYSKVKEQGYYIRKGNVIDKSRLYPNKKHAIIACNKKNSMSGYIFNEDEV